jgi:hypothetical protein
MQQIFCSLLEGPDTATYACAFLWSDSLTCGWLAETTVAGAGVIVCAAHSYAHAHVLRKLQRMHVCKWMHAEA